MIALFLGGKKKSDGVKLVLLAQMTYSEISIYYNNVISESVLWCQSFQIQYIEGKVFALIMSGTAVVDLVVQ